MTRLKSECHTERGTCMSHSKYYNAQREMRFQVRQRSSGVNNETNFLMLINYMFHTGFVVQGQTLAREMFQLRRLQSVVGRQAVCLQEWENLLPRLSRQEFCSALRRLWKHLSSRFVTFNIKINAIAPSLLSCYSWSSEALRSWNGTFTICCFGTTVVVLEKTNRR